MKKRMGRSSSTQRNWESGKKKGRKGNELEKRALTHCAGQKGSREVPRVPQEPGFEKQPEGDSAWTSSESGGRKNLANEWYKKGRVRWHSHNREGAETVLWALQKGAAKEKPGKGTFNGGIGKLTQPATLSC